MILILCALLACCVAAPGAAKCDGNRCDLECAPVSMSWGEFLSRHLDTLWYSDYHNGDSVRVWVDHPRFTPGLWEYRCEVDTGQILDSQGFRYYEAGEIGNCYPQWSLGTIRTIDTTCVWERHECDDLWGGVDAVYDGIDFDAVTTEVKR